MKKILLTGATGTMGIPTLKELLAAGFKVRAFSLNTKKDKKILKPYMKYANLEILWGDLTCYQDVFAATKDVDIVLHVGALVSPMADEYPDLTMKINYGSTINIIKAIKEHGCQDSTKLVFIGSVAETGDRLPPIHWGRVGDPLKPSVFDYYALSKIAAERAVVESGLKYWVSLRQAGIISQRMLNIRDNIMFHQPLLNVHEFVSDRDSGVLLKNLCQWAKEDFWCHIYNIGGGEGLRFINHDFINLNFKDFNVKNISELMDLKWFALRNFHGHYFLDSDILEKLFHFRRDNADYILHCQRKNIKLPYPIIKLIMKLPGFRQMILHFIRKDLKKYLHGTRGTKDFFINNNKEAISAYFISKDFWKAVNPEKSINDRLDLNKIIHIDHGYDETIPKEALSLEMVKKAAAFRGGECLSPSMITGDWKTPLKFKCAFGHKFIASPRLILEAGHWCDQCEKETWNFAEQAKMNPFFAQVWYPLHDEHEESLTVKKLYNEDSVVN